MLKKKNDTVSVEAYMSPTEQRMFIVIWHEGGKALTHDSVVHAIQQFTQTMEEDIDAEHDPEFN